MSTNTKKKPDRQLLLSAFDMHCVVHQNPGMWLYPGDRTHEYKDISYWIEMAQVLEQGGFDALFIADVLGFYDVYGGNRDFAGWKLVGFPGAQRIYTAADLKSGDAFRRAPITGLRTIDKTPAKRR